MTVQIQGAEISSVLLSQPCLVIQYLQRTGKVCSRTCLEKADDEFQADTTDDHNAVTG